jgi:hypothetical protein
MMRYLFCFFALVLDASLFGDESLSMQVEISGSGISSFNNPLVGIKAFTVFLPGCSNKFETQFCIQELEKIGTVKIFSWSKAPIDFEGVMTGMHLTLSIHPLRILDDPDSESEIMQISLLLNSSVEVVKTKHPCKARIWETNVFVTQKNIMDGVKKILRPFVYFYKEVNQNEKPHFNVYF